MYKQNSEFKSIQKKLMAAIAMVLIASIMVVSSSYAWFTLSTAPEVTGITTSVGSNGNLEMALNTNGVGAITTTTSGGSFPEANNYWGNLVNLSDASYGLSSITLAPGRLNLTQTGTSTKSYTVTNPVSYLVSNEALDTVPAVNDKYEGGTVSSVTPNADTNTTTIAVTYAVGDKYNGGEVTEVNDTDKTFTYKVTTTSYGINTDSTFYLQTAIYGTDGRVSALEPNASAATYASGEFSGTGFGVRGVGTISGLTAAEIALRDAKTVITDTKANTLFLARKSLQEDSVKLANIIIAYQMNNSTTFTATDYNNIVAAIANLTAVVDGLESAMEAVVVAVGVAQNQTFTAGDVSITSSAITITNGSVDWSKLGTLESDLKEAAGVIANMRTDLQAATNALPAEADSYTYDDLADPMYAIMETKDLLINNKSIDAYSSKLDIGFAIMDGAPLTIVDGIYANIAKFVENYDAATSIHVKGTFAGTDIDKDFDVTMATQTTAPTNGFYLPSFITALSSVTVQTAEGEESTASKAISDLYAYIIDLGFRTNASGSYLQLQTDAANRVQDSEYTEGAGSYMEFDITSEGYTQAQLVDLMKAIRVVFFDTTNGTIFGVAALDMSAAEVTIDITGSATEYKVGDKYTHEGTEYVIKSIGDTEFTEAATDASGAVTTAASYTHTGVVLVDAEYDLVDSDTIRADLYLYNFSVDNNLLKLNGKMDDDNLLALQQNTATAVSTIVYLDGDYVDNGDVGISGKTVEGKMNLQFSSSADLVPMEYTFTAEETEATEPTLAAPNASISETGVLSWTEEEGVTYVVAYGTNVGNGTTLEIENGGNLQTALAAAGATDGTYKIVVTASKTGYESGAKVLEYNYTAPTGG